MKINFRIFPILVLLLTINEFTLGIFFSSYGKIGNHQILLAIRLFDIYGFLVGIFLIKRKNISSIGHLKLLTLLLIGAFIFLEIMVRSIISIRYNFYINSISSSEKLGWETIENVNLISRPQGYNRVVTFSTGKYGFRQFGNINTSKKKIFIIGDSFTEGVGIKYEDT